MPPEPVLKDFHNIEHRDAVLAYDGAEPATDNAGRPMMRWDGRGMKPHPVTGKDVPDDSQQIAVWKYAKPRKAKWPAADFIVGNPPFIGAATMRNALGDGYVEALRATWKDVPESADFVMYWWQHDAEAARLGEVRRFGFITTNSLRQTFNRRVIEAQMAAKPPLSLAFAIPDHPWVDSTDGAAVRIAMSVGEAGVQPGRLVRVVDEREESEDAVSVKLAEVRGRINADLSIGADIVAARPLQANSGLSSRGVQLIGAGFIVSPEEAAQLGFGKTLGLEQHIRAYRNGRDLTDAPRGVMVIDLFGLAEGEVRKRYPAVYQWVLERVKPARDQNNRVGYRENWWIHGEPRRDLRPALAGLERYIATVETAKHRTFQFLSEAILPDNKLIAIALDDAFRLGVLSSQIHVTWALAAGSTLEDRPVYVKTTCFETYPFPDRGRQAARLAELAEEIDAHRKRQIAEHPGLTLTGIYNVLEALRLGQPLTAKEKAINEQGLVSLLKSRHDELDVQVLAAYGWSDLAPAFAKGPLDEATRQALLARLVALNAERAAEEAAGTIRWLRPEYQAPDASPTKAAPKQTQTELGIEDTAAASPDAKRPWPANLPEQMRAVAEVLSGAGAAQAEAEIAAHFTGRGPWKRRLPQIVDTLVALGRARKAGGKVQAV